MDVSGHRRDPGPIWRGETVLPRLRKRGAKQLAWWAIFVAGTVATLVQVRPLGFGLALVASSVAVVALGLRKPFGAAPAMGAAVLLLYAALWQVFPRWHPAVGLAGMWAAVLVFDLYVDDRASAD